ncbi:host nuclease inhibitor protein [Yersinia enterocolitica]|nr:host nuclease inhibitor protein [Yersinia enterocolitica]ELI8405236.1 host nuclease inhibitor protein [Yersinia enterocolitica]
MTLIAYAWASGLIEFGKTLPNGALPVIKGLENEVRESIEVNARHSRINEQLLVPGVPEANNQSEGYDALIYFTERVFKTYSSILDKGNNHE